MRPVLLRTLAVLGVGVLVALGILLYLSTAEGGAPRVARIGLTQHAADDDRLASTTTSIEVEFSEPVVAESAEGAFRLEPDVDGAFSWSGRTMTFTPAARLLPGAEFRAWVAAGVVDEAGNAMAEPSETFEFRTVGRPAVVRSEPSDGATDVPLDATLMIVFSSPMDTASVEDALTVEPRVDLVSAWSAEQLTLVPAEPLAPGTRYRVRIGAEARDASGVPLGEPYRVGFTTIGEPLVPALVVPADGSDGVAVTTPLAVLVDAEIDPESVNSDTLAISPEVEGSIEVAALPGAAGLADPARRVIRFLPAAPLAASTTYRVTLDIGPADTEGSPLAPLEWSFTTGSPPATLRNQIVFVSDRTGIANLWAMNPDGSGQRQVSAELSAVIDYAVSPDGRTVIVADGAVLVRQRVDGSDRAVLTPEGAIEFDPAWAPNGLRFAFGRADLETGEGLGLWTRAADGSDARQLELPSELRPESSTASPDADPAAAPLLRAPRYSPDGSALAFVDVGGRLGVLELPAARLTTAPFVAAGPPVWLDDSSAVLTTGIEGPPLQPPAAGQPIPALDPGALDLTGSQLASLGIAQLDRGASSARQLGLASGAARPAVSGTQLLYVAVDAATAGAAGELLLTTIPPDSNGQTVVGDAPAISSSGFGPQAAYVVAARVGGGVWLVPAGGGEAAQLSTDGQLPRWMP